MGHKLLLLLLLCLGGCGNEPKEDPEIAFAMQAFSAGMKDPDSAQFRNLKKFSQGVVCGEYNAKNGDGAYIGYRVFISSYSRQNFIELQSATQQDAEILCTNVPDKFAAHARLELARLMALCKASPAEAACADAERALLEFKAKYPEQPAPAV